MVCPVTATTTFVPAAWAGKTLRKGRVLAASTPLPVLRKSRRDVGIEWLLGWRRNWDVAEQHAYIERIILLLIFHRSGANNAPLKNL